MGRKINRSAAFLDGHIVIRTASGMETRFPVAANPRLNQGLLAQLNHIEISPLGLYWADFYAIWDSKVFSNL